MICPESNVVSIPLDAIQCDNNYFKISKPLSRELVRSVLHYGIIEPVLLIKWQEQYVPVCGHNRIIAAQEAGMKDVPAKIVTELSMDDFLQIVSVKLYNNALGTIGKIKSLYLLYDYFNADKKKVMARAQELSLPASLTEFKNIRSIIELPPVIIQYIDSRSISPKFVMPILRLPQSSIALLEKITSACQLRVNYFNSMVVMIEDIYRMGKDKLLGDSIELLLTNETILDDDIHNCIYSIRYPQYTEYMVRINEIKKKLNACGIKVDIPAYLEGDSINVIFEVKKNKPLHPLLKKDQDILGLIELLIGLL
ncbi:MAG: ParB/RepB/Spo0J family partition protein [Spirochaetota bacterium]|nr:ParB/RepB/Spo0J family partition protein [Spirochaetota bacterium]